MSGGQQVEPAELRTAAGAIADALGPAGGIELRPAGAEAYGHPDASGGVDQFSATWKVAILLLTARAESGGKALEAAAEEYEAQEAAVQARMAKVEDQLNR
ncbi:MAG: hypothetical protein ACRDQB_14480 [Thermocrispum sp.]